MADWVRAKSEGRNKREAEHRATLSLIGRLRKANMEPIDEIGTKATQKPNTEWEAVAAVRAVKV